jgi:hypothetical protein
MKQICYLLIILAVLSIVTDLFIAHEVDRIREEIVEIRKDYSYDPKDVK